MYTINERQTCKLMIRHQSTSKERLNTTNPQKAIAWTKKIKMKKNENDSLVKNENTNAKRNYDLLTSMIQGKIPHDELSLILILNLFSVTLRQGKPISEGLKVTQLIRILLLITTIIHC